MYNASRWHRPYLRVSISCSPVSEWEYVFYGHSLMSAWLGLSWLVLAWLWLWPLHVNKQHANSVAVILTYPNSDACEVIVLINSNNPTPFTYPQHVRNKYIFFLGRKHERNTLCNVVDCHLFCNAVYAHNIVQQCITHKHRSKPFLCYLHSRITKIFERK